MGSLRGTTGTETSGIFYKFLGLFTKVYPGEIGTTLLLTLNIFLIFVAYYLIKPVREALIIAGKGAVTKSYLAAAIAVVLIFVVKVFSRVASKFPRDKLITWVTLFFVSNLVIFFVVSKLDVALGTIAIIFFIWIGVFNVLVPAQFWGFANDIYNPEEGKRLFPLVQFGANFGAFFGSVLFGWLILPIGLYQMMLVTAGILVACVFIALFIHSKEVRKPKVEKTTDRPETSKAAEFEKPLKKGGGFQLVFKKKYLFGIALFILLLNFINTNGEFILGNYIEKEAPKIVEQGKSRGLNVEEYIGKFYADFFKYVNLLTLLIQLFLVSRIFKWIGVRGAIFVLPLMALGGYSFIAVGASLLLVRWVKTFENGTDYSLMNTTRHALFLVTSREEKYKAKAAIDTFFHRSGDVLSALAVFVGTTYLALSTSGFAGVNVVLCLIWIAVGVLIASEHKKLAAAFSPKKDVEA